MYKTKGQAKQGGRTVHISQGNNKKPYLSRKCQSDRPFIRSFGSKDKGNRKLKSVKRQNRIKRTDVKTNQIKEDYGLRIELKRSLGHQMRANSDRDYWGWEAEGSPARAGRASMQKEVGGVLQDRRNSDANPGKKDYQIYCETVEGILQKSTQEELLEKRCRVASMHRRKILLENFLCINNQKIIRSEQKLKTQKKQAEMTIQIFEKIIQRLTTVFDQEKMVETETEASQQSPISRREYIQYN